MQKRSMDRLKEHYLIERQLADQLRRANKKQREQLYSVLYNDLFTRVQDHPQLNPLPPEKHAGQIALLKKYVTPDSIFLEIGAGDCAVSWEISKYVRKAIAIDVSKVVSSRSMPPPNAELKISNGIAIDLPSESVDVLLSSHLMEHLHVEDAFDQLNEIYRVLRPNGIYICITPNRLNGPHDISRYFDKVATGFHLKEYTYSEIYDIFKKVGFREMKALIGHPMAPFIGPRAMYFSLPIRKMSKVEEFLKNLPLNIRQNIVLCPLLGICIIAKR